MSTDDFDGRLGDVTFAVARKILGVWQTKVSIQILDDPQYWSDAGSVIALLTEARDRLVAAGVSDPTIDFEADFNERYGSTFNLTMQGSRPSTQAEIDRAKRVDATVQRERQRQLRAELTRLEEELAKTKERLGE